MERHAAFRLMPRAESFPSGRTKKSEPYDAVTASPHRKVNERAITGRQQNDSEIRVIGTGKIMARHPEPVNVEAGLPILDEARRLVAAEIKKAKREGQRS